MALTRLLEHVESSISTFHLIQMDQADYSSAEDIVLNGVIL